jgi:DNA-binding IclR family transcriptional regulator
MKKPQSAASLPTATYTVKALVKALRILDCLAEEERSSATLTELSRRLHLHVSTVHRLMVNLLRQGFAEVDPATGGYRLGYRVLRMGLKVLDRLDFRQVAHPLLRELNQETQETIHLAILQSDHAVSIEKFGSPQPVGLDARLGGIMPLHCTGVGKALLAYQAEAPQAQLLRTLGLERHTAHTITSPAQFRKELTRIREQGYALDNEEAVIGLRCVAAPIFNHEGQVLAAFSVAGPATRITLERVPELAQLVRETAREISFRLGYQAAARSPGSAPS